MSTMQSLVDSQIEVNRAVWASNLSEKDIADKKHLSFKTTTERDIYILKCMRGAVCDLTEAIEELENKINQ